jgi:putative ATPase
VGLADPEALRVATSAAQAFDYVGMPEGRFHLAEACLYLATAPKSNSAFAFFDALAAVERERAGDVPDALKDANRDQEGFGHGEGYLYPHAYRDHWVAQQYLPDALKGRVFYEPSALGREAALGERVVRLREAQLEAVEEARRLGRSVAELAGAAAGAVPSAAGAVPEAERAHGTGRPPAAGQPRGAGGEWALRSEGAVARHLERVRDAVFLLAKPERQSLVLDANAGGGLLVWEALRRSPQGGVWARVDTEAEARALEEEGRRRAGGASGAAGLPGGAPVAVAGPPDALPRLVAEAWARSGGASAEPVRFDRVLARGVLAGAGTDAARIGRLRALAEVLAPQGALVLAETVPGGSERFFAALAAAAESRGALSPGLAQRLRDAEAEVFAEAADAEGRNGDTSVAWDEARLDAWCRAAGLTVARRERLVSPVAVTLTPDLIARWFGTAAAGTAHAADGTASAAKSAAPAPRSRLAERLGDAAGEIARAIAALSGEQVPRSTTLAVLRLERAAPHEEPHG